MKIVRDVRFLLLFVLISVVLYGNTTYADFVYDDTFFTKREELRSITYIPKLLFEPLTPSTPEVLTYRPIPMMSFAINYVFFGELPMSFHITNMLLNGIVTFLVYQLFVLLTRDRRVAFLSALLYAVFPIHTESVAFIKARDEILSTLFGVGSWIVFLHATRKEPGDRKNLLQSAILFLLALLSKEFMIVLPVLFGIVWMWQKKPTWRNQRVVVGYYMSAIAIYLVLRFVAFGGSFLAIDDTLLLENNPLRSASGGERIVTPLKLVGDSVTNTFVPFFQTASYHFNHIPVDANVFDSWRGGIGVLVIIIAMWFVVFRSTRTTALGLGSIIFLVFMPLTHRFMFQQTAEMFAERWMYFPSIGLALIGGGVLTRVTRMNRRIGIALVVLIIGFYSIKTMQRNLVWNNEVSLYTSMIHDSPDSFKGYAALTDVYFEQGAWDAGVPYAKRVVDIIPDHELFWAMLGHMEYERGNPDAAIAAYLQAILVNDTYLLPYVELGRIYNALGAHENARDLLIPPVTQVVEPNVDAVRELTRAFLGLEDYENAVTVVVHYAPQLADEFGFREIPAQDTTP